jgi:uncharacterized membrane protein
MAPIIDSIEISRTPEDVFAYYEDLARHAEWQQQIVRVRLDSDGATRVGSRVTDTRRLPGGTRDVTYEVTEHQPPHTSSFRGINGPIRPVAKVTIEALDGGERSRFTLEFELKASGLGVLLAPIARANARKEIPKSHRRFKEILEREQPVD